MTRAVTPHRVWTLSDSAWLRPVVGRIFDTPCGRTAQGWWLATQSGVCRQQYGHSILGAISRRAWR